jgi:hypothetical protein
MGAAEEEDLVLEDRQDEAQQQERRTPAEPTADEA